MNSAAPNNEKATAQQADDQYRALLDKAEALANDYQALGLRGILILRKSAQLIEDRMHDGNRQGPKPRRKPGTQLIHGH